MFKTIEKQAEAIVIEKKSKFIANAFYVSSVEEAEEKLASIRKKYYDARHNCYAYRLIEEDMILERQSDDGEPSGTAGGPMLNILSHKNLANLLIVVTRYFGGILLGTGGLVKAYSQATEEVIDKANIIEKERGYIAEIITEYDIQKEIEYIFEKNKIKVISKEYTDKITNLIEISEEKYYKIFRNEEKGKYHNLPIKIKENKFIDKPE